jgi:hypothetical protein
MTDAQETFWISDVFVSHTSSDTAYCRALVLPAIEAMTERKFNQYVFMNWNNFGRTQGENARGIAKAYAGEIARIIRASRSIVVVLSKAAIVSRWVAWEVDWWLTNRSVEKMLVILTEECNPLNMDKRLDRATTIFLPNISASDAQPRLQTKLREMLQ